MVLISKKNKRTKGYQLYGKYRKTRTGVTDAAARKAAT